MTTIFNTGIVDDSPVTGTVNHQGRLLSLHVEQRRFLLRWLVSQLPNRRLLTAPYRTSTQQCNVPASCCRVVKGVAEERNANGCKYCPYFVKLDVALRPCMMPP